MRKIFLMMIALLMLMSSAGAATIETAHFNGNEKLAYPVVNTGDAAIDQKINRKIKEELMSFIKGIHYDAQYYDRKVLDARTSYEVGSNQAGNTVILSIVMTESKYIEGAAHPATWQRVLNFNTSSGNRMGLHYLTEVGEGLREGYLLERLEQKLCEKIEREGIYLFEDALPLKQLPENFYWDENLHVHFIFQHYEIAPYAAGIIDVDIDA